MLPYINDRLNAWVDWTRRREDGGLGYPRECPYTRLQGRSGNGGFTPNVDDQAWETEMAVQLLKQTQPMLWLVVKAFYLDTSTAEQKASMCQCGRTVLYERLHSAHVAIMHMLEENKLDNSRTVHV